MASSIRDALLKTQNGQKIVVSVQTHKEDIKKRYHELKSLFFMTYGKKYRFPGNDYMTLARKGGNDFCREMMNLKFARVNPHIRAEVEYNRIRKMIHVKLG